VLLARRHTRGHRGRQRVGFSATIWRYDSTGLDGSPAGAEHLRAQFERNQLQSYSLGRSVHSADCRHARGITGRIFETVYMPPGFDPPCPAIFFHDETSTAEFADVCKLGLWICAAIAPSRGSRGSLIFGFSGDAHPILWRRAIRRTRWPCCRFRREIPSNLPRWDPSTLDAARTEAWRHCALA
jgi:hypothetical protein